MIGHLCLPKQNNYPHQKAPHFEQTVSQLLNFALSDQSNGINPFQMLSLLLVQSIHSKQTRRKVLSHEIVITKKNAKVMKDVVKTLYAVCFICLYL